MVLHRYIAASCGQEGVVKLLLAEKANLEAKNNDGDTPLHRAAYNGQEGVVKLLLAAKANLEAKNNDGDTPLHQAAAENGNEGDENGNEGMVELLLENGANYKAINNDGKTPAQLAEAEGKTEIAKLISEYSQQLKLEVKKAPQKITRLEQIIEQQQQKIEQLEKQLAQLTLKLTSLQSVLPTQAEFSGSAPFKFTIGSENSPSEDREKVENRAGGTRLNYQEETNSPSLAQLWRQHSVINTSTSQPSLSTSSTSLEQNNNNLMPFSSPFSSFAVLNQLKK